MSENKRSELELRDKAILHQQRRLKQATQFTHKDSADLLPLDGLKRLGTSKDLQPHCIVQRRLLEGSMPRLHVEGRDGSCRGRSPLADTKEAGGEAEERSESTADDSTEERSSRSEEEDGDEEEDASKAEGQRAGEQKPNTEMQGEQARMKDGKTPASMTALLVQCSCFDKEVKAMINTGCQVNRISQTCCRRLGLSECPSVTDLQLQLGAERLLCSAHVMEEEGFELCLGLQTLLELKCCVDLSRRVLRIHGSGEELPFLETSGEIQHRRDNNENTTA